MRSALVRRALAALLATALGACAVGPNYRPPPTPPAAAGPFAATAAPASATQPAPPDWWRLYDDATLDALIQEALTENADLKVAAANLLQALGALQEARAGRFPTTLLQAGETWGKSTSLTAALASAESNPHWAFDGTFSVAYQLDLFGQIRRTIEAAKAQAAASAEAEDAVRITIVAETAKAYADACAFAEEVDVARSSADVAQETLDLTRRQRDLGARSDFDVASAAAVFDQAKALIAPLEGQRRASLYALAVLTGRPPETIPTGAAACRTPPRIDHPLPVGDGAALLRRRPDVREAEETLAADTARIGVAVSELYPSVSLTGDVASAGATFRQATSSRGISYQMGPFVTWTFPNILVARARIVQARAQASGDIARFDSTVLQALKETEQALAAYGGALESHADLLANRDDNQRAFDLAKVQLTQGAISLPDLLQTQRNLIVAKLQLAQSDQTLADDQVAVFQALGGGWENAPPVQPPKSP
jgi:NodT family efflux transporter outer membrane factor (OMF) lipoprotein